MLNIFSCPYWSSVYLLWISAYSGPLTIFKLGCLFFFLLLSCICSLYILKTDLLSDVQFANIFSHSIGCLFILMMVSFSVQKVFHFIDPICLFLLLFPFLWVRATKTLLRLISMWLLPMLSSRNWMASSLTLKYLIHIKLILCMV